MAVNNFTVTYIFKKKLITGNAQYQGNQRMNLYKWLICILFLCISIIEGINHGLLSRKEVHDLLEEIQQSKDAVLLEEVARSIINQNKEGIHMIHSNLLRDFLFIFAIVLALKPSKYRSVYYYLGLAHFWLNRKEQATEIFLKATRMDEDDIKSLVYLGICHLFQSNFAEAERILEQAVVMKGSIEDTHHLFKARSWMAKWKDRDELLSKIEDLIQKDSLPKEGPVASPSDFAEFGPKITRALSELIFADIEARPLSCCTKEDFRLRTQKLKLGKTILFHALSSPLHFTHELNSLQGLSHRILDFIQ
jgi:tetratricopeptide (TPR) repeat protein